MKVYRLRKLVNGRPAPGAGLKLIKGLGLHPLDDVLVHNSQIEDGEVILNYGRSDYPEHWRDKDIIWINHPRSVCNAVDKLTTLRECVPRIPTLTFTTTRDVADKWLEEGESVVERHTLTGKKGRGIKVITPNNRNLLSNVPLYTKVYDKDTEFRVHVVGGIAVDYVQKKRKKKWDAEKRDGFKRNHQNGWVFAHHNIVVSTMVKKIAVDATRILGLDFAGVDILAKLNASKTEVTSAVLCEVNSAPGMSSPTTFNAYLAAFSNYKD